MKAIINIGSSGGGGHEIQNASGTELTQRDNLQFGGYLKTSDDSTNDKTVVSYAPTEITWDAWNALTTEQKRGTKWLITNVTPTYTYTINITASSSELYNQTIVVTAGGEEVTELTFSNAGSATFETNDAELYTFSVTLDGITYSSDVDVQSGTVSYDVTIYYFPNGKTITPTDDIPTWLACGGRDEEYTTLGQVLADSTCLSALMADSNAVDYLVRSKKWCGTGLVPTMTSATIPSGEVICTSVDGTYPAWKAFDGDDTTPARASSTDVSSGAYIGYIFADAVQCDSVKIKSSNSANTNTLRVEVSDDGSTWTSVSSNVTTVYNTVQTISLTTSGKHRYYRLYQVSSNGANSFAFYTIQFYSENICDNSSAMSYVGLNNYASNTLLSDSTWCAAICNSTYFESVLNVKVSTMTSNTTPSGAVITRSGVRDNEESWKAFDGNDNTYWLSQAVTPAQGLSGAWIQCEFETPIKIKKLYASIGLSTTTSAEPYFACKLLASNVDNDWNNATVLYDETVNSTNALDKTSRGIASSALNNDNAYKYLRLHVYRTYTSLVYTVNFYDWTTQFYGRADV